MTNSTLEKYRVILSEPPGYVRLLRFAEQVEQGNTPDKDILQDLADAFRQMMAEETKKKRPAVFMRAMHLHGSKGNKQPTAEKESRRIEAAINVFLLDPDGTDQPAAIGRVADDLGIDESNVRRWVKKHKNDARKTAHWIMSIEKKREQE